jgi:hypothetical protein
LPRVSGGLLNGEKIALTAVQRCQNPWLLRMEVNPLDTFAASE